MLKKMLSGLVAGAAMFCMVGNAAAVETHYVRIAGASAQGKYWRTAGSTFLTEVMGCQSAAVANILKDADGGGCDTETNTKNGVVKGTNCTDLDNADTNTADDDTIYIHYLEIASYAGCENAPGCLDQDFVDPEECNFTTGECTCSDQGGILPAPVTVGAADVACEDLDQTTYGYENGIETWDNGNGSQEPFGPYDNPLPTGMTNEKPIVVPFAFIANNTVVNSRCTAPTHATAGDSAHKAYDHFWWQCVKGNNYECKPNTDPFIDASNPTTGNVCHGGPYDGWGGVDEDDNLVSNCSYKEDCADTSLTTSEDCIGYYKCVDGLCSGGVNGPDHVGGAQECSKASECPDVDVAGTTCEFVPLDNLSRLQAMLIFSDTVQNWNEFGKAYPDMTIYKCMRHAGSGTHATLTKAVFRQKYNIATSMRVAQDDVFPTVWHYRSSSDLAGDCVDALSGAVGYVDADKQMGKDYGNSHTMKFEGIEPTRMKIKNGEYSFWAEQNVFYDPDCAGDNTSETGLTIISALIDFAKDSSNLREDNFGDTAFFWATKAEMKYTREGDVDQYPHP